MSLFGNLTSDGLEEAQDRLGGFSALESDVYTGLIKVAYAGQSKGGSSNVTFVFDFGGREYRETIYVTNKNGENFYVNQNNKKVPLHGFTTVDDICLIAGGAPLCDQPTEDKMVKIYDPEEKKEMPKSVPVLTGLLNQKISVAILKQLENKSEKDGNGNYVAIAGTRDTNIIDKVFDVDTKLTVVEAKRGLEAGEFLAAWLEKNKGQTRDKRTLKDGEGGQSGRPGRPGRPAGGPPQAGGSSQGKSLFGKKAA